MRLSTKHTERHEGAPELDRVDPYWRAPMPKAKVTVTGRVGQGRRATVQGTSWRALMDDSAPALLRKVRTAASIELKSDRDAPRVIDAADEIYLQLIEAARAETDGATDWPRSAQTRMILLRLKVRQYRRDRLDRAQAELAARAGTDWDAQAAQARADAEEAEEDAQRAEEDAPRAMRPDAARRAADDALALLSLTGDRNVWTLLYDALRGEDGATVAAELEITLDALKGACKRGRATLSKRFPNPIDLRTALLMADAPDAGSDRTRARMDWDDRTKSNGGAQPGAPSFPAIDSAPRSAVPLSATSRQLRMPVGAPDWETAQAARVRAGAVALLSVPHIEAPRVHRAQLALL